MPITENGSYNVTEKAEVNVQVVAKPAKPYIDSSKIVDFSMFFSRPYNKSYNRADLSLLYTLDTSNGVDFNMFLQNQSSEYFDVPYLDLRKAVDCNGMFYGTKIRTIPQLDFSNATTIASMFFNSYIEECPYLNANKSTTFQTLHFQNTRLVSHGGVNTENGTNFYQMFTSCPNLISIGGELDFGKATDVRGAFSSCRALQEVRFKAIRVFDNNLNFSFSSNLSVESLLSILNALSDNSELDTTYTVTLGTANLEKLTEEQKEIAYSKNIALA
jgi:hypothetical protein